MRTVCIDCRYIGARPSGIAEVVQGLIDFIPALAPDLNFLLLRNPARAEPLSQASNVREVEVPQAANGPATMWWLPRVVDLAGVDLFHATFNIMPAGLKMPCVTTVHDLMWLNHPRWCNPGLIDRAFYRHGIERALRRSAAIATVSEATRRDVVARAPRMAERSFTTLSGVSPDFALQDPDWSVLSRLGLRRDRRYILTVGQYAPYKNHEGALGAFARAFNGRSDMELVMVQRRGRGAAHLSKLAERLNIAPNIRILPPVSREEMVQLYCGATALLHPSFCEGFGNPLAEAMACGCPVVTSDISAMPEVTRGAALMADPRDPAAMGAVLRQVADDPALARTMRVKGLDRARELSWPDFAAANLAIYRKVLGK